MNGGHPKEATRKSKWVWEVVHWRRTEMMRMDTKAPTQDKTMSRICGMPCLESRPPRILRFASQTYSCRGGLGHGLCGAKSTGSALHRMQRGRSECGGCVIRCMQAEVWALHSTRLGCQLAVLCMA